MNLIGNPRRFAGRTMPALIDQEYCTIDRQLQLWTSTMELLDFVFVIASCLCFTLVFLFWWSGPPSRHPGAGRSSDVASHHGHSTDTERFRTEN